MRDSTSDIADLLVFNADNSWLRAHSDAMFFVQIPPTEFFLPEKRPPESVRKAYVTTIIDSLASPQGAIHAPNSASILI